MRETVYWPLPTYLLCPLDSVAYGFSAPPLEAPIAPSKRPSKRGGGPSEQFWLILAPGGGEGLLPQPSPGANFGSS